MSIYDCGNSSNDEYAVELLRRAIVESEQDAQLCMQQYLGDVVRGWLRQHPRRVAANHQGNEEYYVAVTFERFWQLACDRQLEFSTFDSVMPYLRLSLNGAILDKLRTSSRPKEVLLPKPDFRRKQQMEDNTSCYEVWERLQRAFLNMHERRLAYLLFHCGLRPREILHCRFQEYHDVCEINRLRFHIMERFTHQIEGMTK